MINSKKDVADYVILNLWIKRKLDHVYYQKQPKLIKDISDDAIKDLIEIPNKIDDIDTWEKMGLASGVMNTFKYNKEEYISLPSSLIIEKYDSKNQEQIQKVNGENLALFHKKIIDKLLKLGVHYYSMTEDLAEEFTDNLTATLTKYCDSRIVSLHNNPRIIMEVIYEIVEIFKIIKKFDIGSHTKNGQIITDCQLNFYRKLFKAFFDNIYLLSIQTISDPSLPEEQNRKAWNSIKNDMFKEDQKSLEAIVKHNNLPHEIFEYCHKLISSYSYKSLKDINNYIEKADQKNYLAVEEAEDMTKKQKRPRK